MIHVGSRLWHYLSPEQQALARDGAFLVEDSERHADHELTDYSYLVFPFAKLYEGFLKQFFLDLHIIGEHEYNSDHYRIGKALSPNLARQLGRHSAYREIARLFSEELAVRLWSTWKNGRNVVFHYFPHNYRALTLAQATSLIDLIGTTMSDAVEVADVHPKIHHV